jgi:hypothetical protein
VQTSVAVDVNFTEQGLGLKHYIHWEGTFLEALDSAMVLEKRGRS